ncbi:hypothetical protein BJX70DRAFT_313323 [Aspergillus crustosus]
MDRATHVIDPNGEVIIVLQNPNAPLAELSEGMTNDSFTHTLPGPSDDIQNLAEEMEASRDEPTKKLSKKEKKRISRAVHKSSKPTKPPFEEPAPEWPDMAEPAAEEPPAEEPAPEWPDMAEPTEQQRLFQRVFRTDRTSLLPFIISSRASPRKTERSASESWTASVLGSMQHSSYCEGLKLMKEKRRRAPGEDSSKWIRDKSRIKAAVRILPIPNTVAGILNCSKQKRV